MNFSYYKIPIIVHDGIPVKPRWIQIERNSFLILQNTFSILENECLIIENEFPAMGSTQVLLCLFPGVLWL